MFVSPKPSFFSKIPPMRITHQGVETLIHHHTNYELRRVSHGLAVPYYILRDNIQLLDRSLTLTWGTLPFTCVLLRPFFAIRLFLLCGISTNSSQLPPTKRLRFNKSGLGFGMGGWAIARLQKGEPSFPYRFSGYIIHVLTLNYSTAFSIVERGVPRKMTLVGTILLLFSF